VTDALQSTTFRLFDTLIDVILVCGRPSDRGGGTETPLLLILALGL
jgi:hypothetical protein